VHREALEFFYFQGKSIAEVAELVGVPLNTVKTRMLRGRVLMAQLLGHFGIARADSMTDGEARSGDVPVIAVGTDAGDRVIGNPL